MRTTYIHVNNIEDVHGQIITKEEKQIPRTRLPNENENKYIFTKAHYKLCVIFHFQYMKVTFLFTPKHMLLCLDFSGDIYSYLLVL